MLIEQHGFAATGTEVAADSDRPEFCIVFRGKLATDSSIRFDDYLRIDPAVGGAATARGDRLCVDGVDHGDSYDVTVLAGLPADDGETTATASTFRVEIGDRPASVGFKGNTYVLPRTGGTGIPVITVNIDRVRLKVLRVDERNLVQQLNQGRIPNLMGKWDIGQIAEQEGEMVWEGEMDVALEKNQRVTTAFPVGDILEHTQPGIYAAIAEPAETETQEWGLKATQWLVISDLGLTTFTGDDGLNVFVRSLDTAKARPRRHRAAAGPQQRGAGRGADRCRRWCAFSIPVCSRATAGASPRRCSCSPAAATSTSSISRCRPSTSATAVSGGRETPGAVDAFLYPDRGVYRRGETAHVTVMLRDAAAKAVEGLPLTLRLLRPGRRRGQPSGGPAEGGRRPIRSIFPSPPVRRPGAGPWTPISIPRRRRSDSSACWSRT